MGWVSILIAYKSVNEQQGHSMSVKDILVGYNLLQDWSPCVIHGVRVFEVMFPYHVVYGESVCNSGLQTRGEVTHEYRGDH